MISEHRDSLLSPVGAEVVSPAESNPQVVAESIAWFSFHRFWGQLSQESREAIAQSLHPFKIAPGTLIYQEGQIPIGLYFLKWGTVEVYRPSPVGRTHILYRHAGDLLGYTPLLSEHETGYLVSAIALTASELWFLRQDTLDHLIHTHPDIQTILNQLLADDLAHVAQQLAKEQTRIQTLQHYIQPDFNQAPLIGHSKATQKLIQQVEAAANDFKPIVLQAAPGTGKTFLAGYIHRKSGLKNHPFVEINCAQLPLDAEGTPATTALFGQEGGPAGLLEVMERGTLFLDQVHGLGEKERDRLLHYLKTHTFTRNPNPETAPSDTPHPPHESWVRLILASPHKLPLEGIDSHSIKLFPLSQRKGDVADFARYFIQVCCQEQGRPPLQLDQADLRRLVSYDYPGNLTELFGILQRAVTMTPLGHSVIPEQVLWSVQSDKNAFRIDLLNQLPWLRRFLLSRWYPGAIWVIMMALFIPVTVMGYVGPQTREASLTLNFFWAWWWPLYLFLFAYVGRLWCAVCPFMITAEWIRSLSLWIFPRPLQSWNTRWLNRWGAWIVFAGFLAIYLWEQLWDLPHHAYLSASLLVVITLGAVLFSLIYERRLWCRYLCPIGGMNGMFAKLAMIELRSTQQVCGTQCQTYGCYKGSAATPVNFPDPLPTEGQATEGCPLYSHPAQLKDNRDCMFCMSCLKACPNRSAQLNLRFPATDLLEDHQGFWAEAALLLLLLGGVLMHEAPTILGWFGFQNIPLDAEHLLTSTPIVLALLSVPALVIVSVHGLTRLFDRTMPSYLPVIYVYLPFALAANLAYYVPAGMTEAGQILPVIARTFGFDGTGLPTLTWSMDVAQFLQGVTLLSAPAFSIYPLLRITKRSLLSNFPHLILMLGFTIFFFKLMIYS